jgi:hypothetical protein
MSPRQEKPGVCDSCNNTILDVVLSIQKKLDASASLSVELDRLNLNIENLEVGQKTIITSVQKISDAIYHPDNGLYSRIKCVETTADYLAKEIKANSTSDSEDLTNFNKQIEKISTAIAPLPSLILWKDKVTSISKWFATTVGVSTIGLLSKYLYDAIVSN